MTPQPFDLSGKVALVTGGGRGIGLAISQQLAACGARVVIAGRTEQTLIDAVAQIPGEASWRTADVADEDSVIDLIAGVERDQGQLDILVNNAGVNPYYRRSEATSLAQWDDIVTVNMTGVFLCTREAAKGMLARQSGSVINITSIAGSSGLVRSAAYCASKAGVESMTRSLAHEWGDRNVRVNCVAPGYVATDLTEGLRANESLEAMVVGRTPMRRIASPAEMAGAVTYLASDAASYVTGTTLKVDGGWTAA